MNEIVGTGLDDALMLASPDHLFDEELDHRTAEATRRGSLEDDTRIAAEILDAFEANGPLRMYVEVCRDKAKDAMARLIDLDPSSESGRLGIVTAQKTVRDFVDVCVWIDQQLEAGTTATKTIREEFGDERDE
jgi:hypothetical protein